uniref:Zinc finger FYVE domain-containing protein 16 n=1 Tax=Lygus hesperus TaxID=30085 RepID=A0A0A9YT37_LYGHE
MDLFKKGFIHPNAHGSYSLKKILPAMCPDFQYGVFGNEHRFDDTVTSNTDHDDIVSGRAEKVFGLSSSMGADGEGQQDEQRGDNAMGVYRLWYHQEGGSTIQELQRSQRMSLSPLDNFRMNSCSSSLSRYGVDKSSHLHTLPIPAIMPVDVRERT